MYYDEDHDTTTLDARELAGLVSASGAARGQLCSTVVPAGDPQAASVFVAGAAALPGNARAELMRAGAALADPVRTAELHIAVADESLRRLTLSWAAPAAGEVAVLGRTGEVFQLTMMSTDEMREVIAGALGASGPLFGGPYRVALSGWGTITLLAMCDVLRERRLRSMLDHAQPLGTFTAGDVAERMADAACEDFRWPLAFFDKVLPFDVSAGAGGDTVARALGELVDSGLLSVTEAEGGMPALYTALPDAGLMADAVLHEVSKIAVTFYEMVDGALGYESMLLVRASDTLWAFDVTNAGGGVSTVGALGLEDLAGSIAGGPPAA